MTAGYHVVLRILRKYNINKSTGASQCRLMLPSFGPFATTNNNATYRRNRRRSRLAPCTGMHEIYETNEYRRPAPFAVSLIRGRSTVTTLVRTWRAQFPSVRGRTCVAAQHNASTRAPHSLASHISFFFGGGRRKSPQWARASSFTRFLDHTQRRITVSRTPVDG